MTVYIGVDGGLSGAIAFLRPALEGQDRLVLYGIPKIERRVRNMKRYMIDVGALNIILGVELGLGDDAIAWIESGIGDRRQSSSAAYNYGFVNGAVSALIKCRIGSENVHFLAPAIWKRFHGLIMQSKDQSRTKAMRKFPDHRDLWRTKHSHNSAEAALIALYGCELEAAKQ